jgi:predicted aspartyl protease
VTNNNNVTEVYNVRNIAWTASNVNKLLATLAVSSLLSGCGGGGGGDSDSTPAAKPPIENKKDETPPVITLEGENSITVYLGNVFEDPGYSATDNVDGDISKRVKVSYDKPIDTGTVGSYTLTYKVTDTAGNEATTKRVVEVVEGIVFRDSKITLYENEYQHRIWYDVKSDNIDASTITVKLSNQSTATVEKEQGKMLDVELVEVKNSTSKSGYFTLAIHDDEEFEGKEVVVAEVFSNDVFVKVSN